MGDAFKSESADQMVALHKFYCKKAPDKIIENAKNLKVDTILCACNGCDGFIGGFLGATKRKLQAMSFPEIFLQGLEK